ncbi:HK97 gp10 family phage protein [Sphingomonas koreensis]|uniref:HK97 gp10 family phage protein n=2 Tax=Sphingomonas koreensis TaxID=93064 RepID=UPI001F49B4FF|nr:HK97 gp10 family phage protein [Sphingomonas koreensis]
MIRPTMRLHVDARIDRRLEAMADVLTEKVLVGIMTKRLEPMADAMRDRVDVRSGQLRDSIHVGRELSPSQAAQHVPIAEVEVFAGAGPLVQAVQEEFGNFRQAPDPFVAPAFEEHGEPAARNIAADGLELIERAAKKG